jgi:DNA-binding transcriptional LysR family regulator
MLPFDEEQQSLNKSPLDDETLLSGQFWGELRVFLAVAKTRSFNRAAEIANTSQPTASRQVKRLQDVVGSQLFISTPRGVRLTQKGEALAKALSRLDQTLYSITSDLRAESRDAEGTVRVSITDGLNALFAAPALLKFSAQYPRIQLHLKNPLNHINLRENQTDMMIGFMPSASSDIQFLKLGQLHFIPVVSKEYISRYGLPTQDNLEQHLFIQSE